MQQLTQNAKHNLNIEPLIYHLQTEVPLIISSNGAKGDRRNGGGWIGTLTDGTCIISVFNPNYGKIKAIKSYRVEIYTSLAAVLFIHLYSEHHSISIQNQYRSICDNQVYVNKLNWLLDEDFHHHGLHKETEDKVLQLIIHIITKQFSIQHILEH